MMKHAQGFTVIEIVVALIVAAVLVLFVIDQNLCCNGEPRSKVYRVKADQRTFASAIEAYYIDHDCYPAWSADPKKNIFEDLAADKKSALNGLPTFMIANGTNLKTLTTPVSYIQKYYPDSFSPAENATFCFWARYPKKDEKGNPGWIIWSAGPDQKYDLTMANIAEAYDPNGGVPSPQLINLTYDPTNGTTSAGDVWRVKQ